MMKGSRGKNAHLFGSVHSENDEILAREESSVYKKSSLKKPNQKVIPIFTYLYFY